MTKADCRESPACTLTSINKQKECAVGWNAELRLLYRRKGTTLMTVTNSSMTKADCQERDTDLQKHTQIRVGGKEN